MLAICTLLRQDFWDTKTMATAYPGGLRKRGGLLENEDTIQATPRNAFFGGVADLLGQAYKLPEMPRLGVPGLDFVAANRNRLMDLLGVGDVQKTAEALSYGNRLGTGRGMTYQPLPETVGAAMAVAPMVAPAARMAGEGVAATGRFVAPKAGLLAEQYMVSTGGILPLDVYHGTPHTLPPTPRNLLGEFDASKIGTGEGAQAYGYGTYVAESPAVAKGYQESLSKRQFLTKDGFFDPSELEHLNVKVTAGRGDLDKAIELARKYGSPDSDYPDSAARAARDLQKLEALKAAGGIKQNTGNLYKIDLPDEKIAQMLDFDKPLSQQKNILDALTPENMGLTLRPSVDGGYMAYLADGKPIGLQVKGVTPEVFREKWISRLREMGDLEGGAGRAVGYLGGTVPGDLPPLVAKALRQAGIPGIKYLDEGSRSAGKGTRNFVVFPGEEKSMTILERNAQKAEELKRLQSGGLLAP